MFNIVDSECRPCITYTVDWTLKINQPTTKPYPQLCRFNSIYKKKKNRPFRTEMWVNVLLGSLGCYGGGRGREKRGSGLDDSSDCETERFGGRKAERALVSWETVRRGERSNKGLV